MFASTGIEARRLTFRYPGAAADALYDVSFSLPEGGVLGVAVFEALALTETGFRANDGNFEWGSLALYPTVFGLAAALLWRLVQRTDWKKRGETAKAIVGIVLLLGHLAVGLYCLYRPGHAGYDWFYF